MDSRALRDALARPRDADAGRLAEGLEQIYTTLLRRAEEVPLAEILDRVRALKPQLVGSEPGASSGKLQVRSRQSSAVESNPYQGESRTVLKLKNLEQLGPEVGPTALRRALERALHVESLDAARITHLEEWGR